MACFCCRSRIFGGRRFPALSCVQLLSACSKSPSHARVSAFFPYRVGSRGISTFDHVRVPEEPHPTGCNPTTPCCCSFSPHLAGAAACTAPSSSTLLLFAFRSISIRDHQWECPTCKERRERPHRRSQPPSALRGAAWAGGGVLTSPCALTQEAVHRPSGGSGRTKETDRGAAPAATRGVKRTLSSTEVIAVCFVGSVCFFLSIYVVRLQGKDGGRLLPNYFARNTRG